MIDIGGTGGAEPNDGGAVHVLPPIVLVADCGHVEPVAQKLHAIDGSPLLRADITGKTDAFAVGERATFAGDLHSDRGMAGGLDADDADGLEIRPVVARRLDAPLPQVFLDIGGRQADARG